MLNGIDLFSGIGGMSLGLRGICKTIAYCEIDPICQRVLRQAMQNGCIDCAPIYNNVLQLHGSMLPKSASIIYAGFPCQDVSTASDSSLNVDSKRTGLFKEVIRLAREMPQVKYIFLENVQNIEHRGLQRIIDSVVNGKFNIVYSTFYAYEVGLPHKRARWFALCFKQGLPTREIQALVTDIRNSGLKHTTYKQPPKMMPKDSVSNCVKRYGMLGNAVCPQCVTFSFVILASMYLSKLKEISQHNPNSQPTCKKSEKSQKTNKVTFHIHNNTSVCERSVIDHCGNMKIQLLNGMTLSRWGTPTASFLGQYHTLTQRSLSNLQNQLFWCKKNQEQYNSSSAARDFNKYYQVNPAWIEWLMGFPKYYTL